MKKVVIESPLRAQTSENFVENLCYAKACLADSLDRGEAPIASHLLYTQVLDDYTEEERKLGIEAGLEWIGSADLVAVYMDRGLTSGMKLGIEKAKERHLNIEYRWLGREYITKDVLLRVIVFAAMKLYREENQCTCARFVHGSSADCLLCIAKEELDREILKLILGAEQDLKGVM